jgi:3-oxoacyl-[acyl-carrier-protein] synthase II
MKDRQRVVITGMGAVSSLGIGTSNLWAAMMAGRSGIDHLRSIDASPYKVGIGAEVKDDELSVALKSAAIRKSDRTLDLATLASHEALTAAGLIQQGIEPEHRNVAVIFGTGAGSQHRLYESVTRFVTLGVKGVRPTSVPRCMANAISSRISIRYRFTGANFVIISACTSAANAIGTAFRMLRDGYADCVLTGGSEAIFSPDVYAGWDALGMMSKNPQPQQACRPFDVARDGCVLGEGAGALVIETLQHAQQRGAEVRGEIIGYGESSDAAHITLPNPQGQSLAIDAALTDACVVPGEVGYINAHGTATPSSDESESAAIRMTMGSHVSTIPVGSNKSFLGHTIGASGALESIVTIMGLERRTVPANLNLDEPDPACDIRLVGRDPMTIESPVAIKNSFGFGGGNGVLVFRRWEQGK